MKKHIQPIPKTSYKKIINLSFYLYLTAYTVISTLTLTVFPRVHSDETWIGGLSYSMFKSGSLFTTEPFFDLFPRTPHTMKILFHFLQQISISIFGLNIFNIRLVSLVFGLLTLMVLYNILIHICRQQINALLITIASSLTLPFLYTSHFARQEIVLVFVLALCYYLYDRKVKFNQVIIPILIGISISIHPNAFIIACMIGFLLLKDLITKKSNLKVLTSFVGTLGLFALGNIIVSIIQNPNFIHDYITYGSTLSVTAAPASRFENFRDFYLKLFYQITGTYYIPPMKLLMAGTGLLFIIGSLMVLFTKFKSNSTLVNSLLMFIGFNSGIFIIGRFNTTSIIFAYIPSILLFTSILSIGLKQIYIKKNTLALYSLSVLIVLISYNTYTEINMLKHIDYSVYEEEIASVITSESVVLGNLSSAFVFKDISFKDIRNLEYLNDMTVLDYIITNNINTIVYYEEYDYIHRNQQWEILYGDDQTYYDELNQIISNSGSIIHEFESYNYGTRIIRYMGEYPWKVTIYQLDL